MALVAAALVAMVVLTAVGGAQAPDGLTVSSATTTVDTSPAVAAAPTGGSTRVTAPPRGPAGAGPDAYASPAPRAVAAPPTQSDAPAPTDSPSPAKPPPADVDDTLPATVAAAEPAPPEAPLIVLDPGHGGTDTGALSGGIVERESNLDLALRVEEILVARGYRVSLTRRDPGFSVFYPDGPIPEAAEVRTDLQARVDFANALEADVFVSIHSNQAFDTSQHGVEVWYSAQRTHSLANFRLAGRLHNAVVVELIAFGYPVLSRGALSDECHSYDPDLERCLPLFVLAPPMLLARSDVEASGLDPDRFAFLPGEELLVTRASDMPAALVELLFQSNPADAAVLRNATARQAMARGVARAIIDFLESDDRTRPPDPGEPAGLLR